MDILKQILLVKLITLKKQRNNNLIPTQIHSTGDLTRTKLFEGFAREELRKLRRRMSFSAGVNEDYSVVRPSRDVVIECWVSFSVSIISIYVKPPEPKYLKNPPKYKKEKTCLCLPHFALGRITEVIPDIPVKGEEEEQADFENRQTLYNAFIVSGQFTYNVEICAEDKYILYEGMYSTGWGRYYQGQNIIVTVGDSMDAWESPLDCTKKCVSKLPQFDIMVISSIHVPGFMVKWKESLPELQHD